MRYPPQICYLETASRSDIALASGRREIGARAMLDLSHLSPDTFAMLFLFLSNLATLWQTILSRRQARENSDKIDQAKRVAEDTNDKVNGHLSAIIAKIPS